MKLIGEGRNRVVYMGRSGKYVVKVPKNDAGASDNCTEYGNYRSGHWAGRLARCRLVQKSGTPYLVMEVVRPVPDSDLPDWASYIDCQQVGRNRRGQLVAYDWA